MDSVVSSMNCVQSAFLLLLLYLHSPGTLKCVTDLGSDQKSLYIYIYILS